MTTTTQKSDQFSSADASAELITIKNHKEAIYYIDGQ